MLIQTYNDVANQTFLRLIYLLNSSALAMGAINQAAASWVASQAGLNLKDFFHNRLIEYNLPDDFTFKRAANAETYAVSAGYAMFMKVKSQNNRSIYDRLGDISQAFVDRWVEFLV